MRISIRVEKSASMQKRTSPLKFGDLAEKSGLNSVSNLSTKAVAPPPRGPRADAAAAPFVGDFATTRTARGGMRFRRAHIPACGPTGRPRTEAALSNGLIIFSKPLLVRQPQHAEIVTR